MNRFVVAFFAFALLVFSCKGGSMPASDGLQSEDSSAIIDTLVADTILMSDDDSVMPHSADELFDDFFFNFISNAQLQKSRVQFPLTVFTDSTKAEQIGRDAWQTKQFLTEDECYTTILDDTIQLSLMKETAVNQVVVEKILFNIQTVKQFLFKRNNGIWYLVSINNEPFYKNPNVTFLNFYHKFANDSIYQKESLMPTVSFSIPDPEDDFSRVEGLITAETWSAFAPELPRNVIYNTVYGNRNAKSDYRIFILRGISNGEETEMTFKLSDNRWMLTKLEL